MEAFVPAVAASTVEWLQEEAFVEEACRICSFRPLAAGFVQLRYLQNSAETNESIIASSIVTFYKIWYLNCIRSTLD